MQPLLSPPPPDTASRGSATALGAGGGSADELGTEQVDKLIRELSSVVGATHVLCDHEVVASYTVDWTGRFSGPATLVVRPGSALQVGQVLRVCSSLGVSVVVQGGNTGLVGGSVPPRGTEPGPAPILLSTTRLNEIGTVDTVTNQVTVGAGATLAELQRVARASHLSFPVDLAARDSATLGGMTATNAGGLHVLRYGGMRRQVLGVEAVLADSTVVSRLAGLAKDNTGYDLSQLMIGSEGTLGVVTAIRLQLVPHLPDRAVALVGLDSTRDAIALTARLRSSLEALSAAEIFYQDGLDLVCDHAGLAPPLGVTRAVYLLVEATGRGEILDELAGALACADLEEEATALSGDEVGAMRLWSYRERHTEAISSLGVAHKLDVTLPIRSLAAFEQEVRHVVARVNKHATLVLFGHVGDGNLHVNIVGPSPEDETVDGAVLELVASYGGSISAEHGIGRAKVAWLGLSRSPAELAAMRAIKDALDPDQILNRGVLLPPRSADGPV